jgi:hypothetical protein
LKKLFLLTGMAVILAASNICAQSIAQQSASPFIFPEFASGTVFQKNGATLAATLDYNTITQEMMFDQNGSKLVLDQVENIDSIVIQNCVFVPAKGVFFEKLTKTPVALYAQYKSKAVKKGSLDELGGGASPALAGAIGVRNRESEKPGNYNMQLPQNFKLETQIIYWLKKDNDFIQVNNLKVISKRFPGKESQIDAFIKENSISLGKIQNMIKLIEFSNK